MIRITIAISAILLLFGCENMNKSTLVLESDLWVATNDTDNYSMSYELKKQNGAPAIEFLTDGRFVGLACCNSFSGQYTTQTNDTIDYINLLIEEIDMELCKNKTQNLKYIEIIEQVRNYVIKDGRLELMDNLGKVTMSFIPASTTQK